MSAGPTPSTRSDREVIGEIGAYVPVGRLGMWVFLVADAASFGALLAAYGVLRARSDQWIDPATRLDLPLAAVMTFVLLASSLTMALAGDAATAGRVRAAVGWLLATIALGVVFLGGQSYEYASLHRHGIGFAFDQAASTYYACTAWHGLHVAAGVLYLGYVATMAARDSARGPLYAIATAGLFWQFLDAAWILIFTFVYLV